MATERLLATSYRFEINKGGNSKRHAEELRIAVSFLFLELALRLK